MPNANKQVEPTEPGRDPLYPPRPDPDALAALLNGWMQGDATEQRETFEILRRALDEDRPEGYEFFP